MWLGIGNYIESLDQVSWITNLKTPLEKDAWFDRYWYSIYWSITTMTSVGYVKKKNISLNK